MKKVLFIVLIGIISVGCDESLELTNNIQGNLYSCVEEGGYSEYHINEEYMQYYFEAFDEISEYAYGYYLSNDTVFFTIRQKRIIAISM